MTETVDNETRAFIEAVQLLEDAGWVVLRPDSKLLRQSDTRIEGGGEKCPECGKPLAECEAGYADAFATPEHVEGDVLSVEMEATRWSAIGVGQMSDFHTTALALQAAEAQLADAVKVLEPFASRVALPKDLESAMRAARAFLSSIGEKPDAE